jgi:ubiquinone/menaquinone biosynthesis C-methylase UbiE
MSSVARPSHRDRARLDFVLDLRRRWADTVYPVLAADAMAAADPPDPSTIRSQAVYPWFAWLERGSQKMLWRAVREAVRADPQQPPPATADVLGRLQFDPQLHLPEWYTDVDIHIQPGGIWSSDEAALVYELGAQLVMLGANDDYAFHDLFTRTAIPRGDYGRIVDLGCGFGKSTRPFKRLFPTAEVIGVDLAAPCLRLAHEQAERRGLAIDFLQRDCRRTQLPSGSCDLVTATMLVHELPVEAIAETIDEAARILAAGGLLRVLDFQLTGEPVRDLAMREHGARNNEPFMPPMFDADLPAMCASAGLVEARWVAFDERGAGRLDELRWPARAEWHFPWAVLEARRG